MLPNCLKQWRKQGIHNPKPGNAHISVIRALQAFPAYRHMSLESPQPVSSGEPHSFSHLYIPGVHLQKQRNPGFLHLLTHAPRVLRAHHLKSRKLAGGYKCPILLRNSWGLQDWAPPLFRSAGERWKFSDHQVNRHLPQSSATIYYWVSRL